MAFKMKGSAFKLGNVATKSALKNIKWWNTNPKDRKDKSKEEALAHNAKHTTGDDSEHASMAKMKSPMKDGNAKHVTHPKSKVRMHDDGSVHREAPTKMKSPLEQNWGSVTQESTDWDIYNPNFNRASGTPSGFNTARTKGRGDKMRFEPGSDGYSSRHEKEWIHSQVGGRYQDLKNLSRKELIGLQNQFYNLYKGEVPVEKEEVQVLPTPKEKEIRYPTNKRTSGTYTGNMPEFKEVWDQTVNNGEGGYVRVDENGNRIN